MPFGSPATEVIMTDVELVMAAAGVVISTFSPLASFSSTPMSSMNALRVPDPSSREYTETSPDGDTSSAAAASPAAWPESALFPEAQPARANAPRASTAPTARIMIFFFISFLSSCSFSPVFDFAAARDRSPPRMMDMMRNAHQSPVGRKSNLGKVCKAQRRRRLLDNDR